ncbi:MAG TPA: hypothetical protein VNN22_05040 [Verrucomicrobiae bacterium]|nr:hypothetical protein [Verrucomicrobiae bacterium]
MEFIIPAIIIVGISIAVFSDFQRRRKLASMTVVKPGTEYPNNHHVLGVGYYHAASQLWFSHPWNEYREDRGYYWGGTWNPTPDQRMVSKSIPLTSEVERVNQAWRKADPDRVRRFWVAVEQEGFGTAIRRSEGS